MGYYVIEEHSVGGKPTIVGRVSGYVNRREARKIRNEWRKQAPHRVFHERWVGP